MKKYDLIICWQLIYYWLEFELLAVKLKYGVVLLIPEVEENDIHA